MSSIDQLARQHHSQMIADARQRQLRHEVPRSASSSSLAGASATERSDVAARGPLTSFSLVCLVASGPVACRSGS